MNNEPENVVSKELPGEERTAISPLLPVAEPALAAEGTAIPSAASLNAARETREPEINAALCREAATQWYPARMIARAGGWSKKTVARMAAKQSWPSRPRGNMTEYQPSPDLAEKCALLTCPLSGPAPEVRYVDLGANAAVQRKKVLLRKAAVECYLARVEAGYGIEFSQSAACAHAFRVGLEMGIEDFTVGIRTIREWVRSFQVHGIDGLVEQKQGKVGAKSAMSKLSEDERVEFVRRGKALAIEHGSGGRANVARAAQEMMTHPDLCAPLRPHLHEAHASKSYVTPSIRAALKPAPLTAVLAQAGTCAARLASAWTPGDYSDVKAGDVFVSDDMTSNVICWCEWPNRLGYRIGQPQLLPVMDVGSLRWLNFRAIMREGGQYNAHDDIWGLFGDVFDVFGLPKNGFLLEGGHWQSKAVRGHRTGLSDEERIGGLSSLGLQVWRAYGPTGKAVIETSFNQLQHAADAFPGFIGREQRVDVNETVERRRRLCATGQEHPRRWFPHLSEWSDHIQSTMERLNIERNDGLVLRGSNAIDKWVNDAPVLKALPDSAKWLYRSAMSLVQVTRNGVRVTQGSGAKLVAHYYDNAELLVPRQGQRVIVYWNDSRPETDAVILSASKPRLFIGTCKYVKPLSRFGASDAELDAEATRKKASLHYARTEMRSVQPEFQRTRDFVGVNGGAGRIGAEIASAKKRAEKEEAESMNFERAAAQVRARVRTTSLDETDLPPRETVPRGGITEEELEQL